MGLVVGQSFGPLPYGPLDHPLTTILPLHPDRYQEKYAPVPIAAATASRTPATLLSLPVELLRAIIDHLDPADQKTLFSVCYRLLSVAFPHVYSACQQFDARRAMLYIKARVSRSFSLLFPTSSPTMDLTSRPLCRYVGDRE